MSRRAFAVAASIIVLAVATSFAQDAATAPASSSRAPATTLGPGEAPAQVTPPDTQTPAPAPTPAPARPWVAGYKGGFALQSESGDFKLKLTGYAQADGRFAARDGAEAPERLDPVAPCAPDRPAPSRSTSTSTSTPTI